jgi:hypothetical protein
MKRILACAAFMLLSAWPALPQPARVFGAALVANGVWYDGEVPITSDVEAGLALRASLSPHISLVGSSAYGLANDYWRYAAGIRMTATDVDNRDFSVGLGFQYRGSYDGKLAPDEWAPDATIGWRPWPTTLPDIILSGHAWYGIDTNRAGALAGIRYVLPL